MKLNLAIPGLLIALLVGCNDTTTVATSASPSATPSPTTTPVVPEKTSGGAKYTPKSLGLSEAQFKDISQLQGLPYSIKKESGSVDISKQFRIALPASIPDEFRVNKIEVFKGEYPGYSILYKNKNNECFLLNNFTNTNLREYRSNAVVVETFEVSSIGLGKISVNYFKYDRDSDKNHMKAKDIIDGQVYKFNSPIESCNIISKQEAIKIIKSIDYVF
ncbi:hypothetical protein [Microcoleus sp. PH2017_30_WIL_O_A]|uniref:hypothetical protein n=1 Tax=Microcoleus sp. PH2017_30_WIL_O_A TaxID=2798840 RepID=UPI001D76979E|nr:hypothetical protein [Microcoleus sp. PH2017_30_WIL_O_A]MCC3582633.1 hypothetical protein [Microcoleus sp. PH2017_30_WIL_O_A]